MSGDGRGVRVGGEEPTVWLPKLAAPESLGVRLQLAAQSTGEKPSAIRRAALRRYLDELEKQADFGHNS